MKVTQADVIRVEIEYLAGELGIKRLPGESDDELSWRVGGRMISEAMRKEQELYELFISHRPIMISGKDAR